MESPRNLPALQPYETYLTIKPETRNGEELGVRTGQEESFNLAATIDPSKKEHLAVILPTGYGKTRVACGVYGILRERGIVDRALVLVPSVLQKNQFTEKYRDNADRLGLKVVGNGAYADDSSQRSYRINWERESEFFVATYQQVIHNLNHFDELINSGKWLVVYDEVHHLAEDSTWGKAAHKLNRDFSLYMSATPVRSDRQCLIGIPTRDVGDGEVELCADVEVSIDDALKEKALRRPIGEIGHYFVDVEVGGEVQRITTEFLKEEGVADFSSYETKRALRYCQKYLSKILLDAAGRLDEKNSYQPNQHQMLVFCMTCNHAKAVSEGMNALRGAGFSDWIGVTRTTKENGAVMARYMNNALPCLVQVDKAGEGFDYDRCSVLLFLHLLKSDSKIVQQIGRGLRRNYNLPFTEDTVHIFASADTAIAEKILDLDARARMVLKEETRESDEDRQISLFSIPELVILDAQFERTQIITHPLHEGEQRGLLAQIARDYKVPIPLLEQMIREGVGGRDAKISEQQAPRGWGSETEKVSHHREAVDRGISQFSLNIARLRYGNSIQPGVIGDIKRTIHIRWKKEGGLGHDAMTADEFDKKNKWVIGMNEELKATRRIPSWLQL